MHVYYENYPVKLNVKDNVLSVACAFLYWFRHMITLFYLLVRKVKWSEVIGLLVFIALFEIGLVIVGGGAFRDYSIELGWLDVLALVFLLFGSFLNSFSEIQRKWWKKNPSNKGHCYTDGLFKFSMHINYFGDVILFAGFAMITHSFTMLVIPLIMALNFAFYIIPSLDKYLEKKYGEEFKEYSGRTKKLIPMIY